MRTDRLVAVLLLLQRREQVTATEVSMQDDGSVQATITYVYKDGSVVAERTSFGLVRDDGQLKINSSHALSSHTQ